ncbi:MAG TPA: hypothetical protein PLA68_12885 [Panacibacter sp.]|nr:hypothetical protein [Panacibacter sp.]
MKNSNIISEELKSIAPVVADLGRNNPYTVPMGYFASLAEKIMNFIKKERQQQSVNPYDAPPVNYFNELASSIIQKIKLQKNINEINDELNNIAPLLNSIGNENLYSAPDGYFKNFEIIAKPDKVAGKIIPMGSNIGKWVTYAAAACVFLIVSSTSYLYVHTHSRNIETSPSIEQRLASLNDKDIINYLKDDEEIPGDFIPALDEQGSEIQHLLQNTSNEEIQSYLDDNSDSGEKKIKGI